MAEAQRITVRELKERMEGGEDFTIIDVRNPQAWSESNILIRGDPRPRGSTGGESTKDLQGQIRRSILHLTQRRIQRPFGAEASGTRICQCVCIAGWISSLAGSWTASGNKRSSGLGPQRLSVHRQTERSSASDVCTKRLRV
jgi:hypothetical protein